MDIGGLNGLVISDKDIELIWSNAKTYYDTSDKEYIDGCAIWAVFKKTVAKISDKASFILDGL